MSTHFHLGLHCHYTSQLLVTVVICLHYSLLFLTLATTADFCGDLLRIFEISSCTWITFSYKQVVYVYYIVQFSAYNVFVSQAHLKTEHWVQNWQLVCSVVRVCFSRIVYRCFVCATVLWISLQTALFCLWFECGMDLLVWPRKFDEFFIVTGVGSLHYKFERCLACFRNVRNSH